MGPYHREDVHWLYKNFHYVAIGAGLLGLAKVYFHHPQDVTFSFVIGLIVISILVYFLMRFVIGLFDVMK